MSNAPELSIIIPTHNRPALLQRVVAALRDQSVSSERYEIIVADSNSSDDTPQALERLSAPNFKSIRVDKPGAAAARNAGLNAARGEWLLLLDDDILVEKDFLKTLLDAAKRHPDGALLGFIDAPWSDSTDPFLRFLLQAQDVNRYEFSDPQNVSPQYFYTACVAFSRRLLNETRFDEQFSVYGMEDIDFGIRLLKNNARMVYVPELRVRHEYFPRFGDYRRKKRNMGRSLSYFLSKSPQHQSLFYIEPNATRRWYRLYRLIAAPLAGALYLLEKMLKRRGPVFGMLYTWFNRDLRVQMYNGMREHQRK